ncbi:unnamed protein product, partial [Amoebophrya sp. A25]
AVAVLPYCENSGASIIVSVEPCSEDSESLDTEQPHGDAKRSTLDVEIRGFLSEIREGQRR